MKSNNHSQARKFEGVINNPLDKGVTHEIIRSKLESLSTFEYACVADEIATTGTPHTHFFVVYKNPKLWSTIRKLFEGKAHVDVCRGTCSQNRDYIQKGGKWLDSEKHDTVLEGTFEEWGTMPEDSAAVLSTPRKDADIFDQIQALLDAGNTPKQILSVGAYMFKYENYIRGAYFAKRAEETPPIRENVVYYHTGRAGSGKSYTYVDICKNHKLGEDAVYLMTDYANGGTAGFDRYCGEPILFMDEFKSNIPYTLLLQILDKYKIDIHARYHNVMALWVETHISSVFDVGSLYKGMVDESDRQKDSISQLLRRIDYMVYHYKTDEGEYRKIQIPMSEYKSLGQLEDLARRDYEYYKKMKEFFKEDNIIETTSAATDSFSDALNMFGAVQEIHDKEEK